MVPKFSGRSAMTPAAAPPMRDCAIPVPTAPNPIAIPAPTPSSPAPRPAPVGFPASCAFATSAKPAM